MKKEACFYLGTIVGKYSFKGEILVKTDTDNINSYTSLSNIFIDIDNRLIPYFVNKCLVHKSSLLRFNLEDVSDEQFANSLLRKKIYLPLKLLPNLDGNKFYYHEVIGFTIKEQSGKKIGILQSVNNQTPQALFEILDNKERLILVPVHDDFIAKVDKKSSEIILILPDGLLDVYRP